MRSFFKFFFASLLSIIVFCMLCLFLLIAVIGGLASRSKPDVPSKSVLVIDLAQAFHERAQNDPMNVLTDDDKIPGLFDVIRLIRHAKTDDDIAGIYIEADGNGNGFASSNELRQALLDFRSSKKFVIAHGDVMTQGAYYVASAADKIYVNPGGGFEWKGYAVNFAFVKDLLDRLDVQPQIFYAGKYKSATEMFRTNQMTPENKLQTTAWLNDLYGYFLLQTAQARNVDTATLHRLANEATIRTPQDALQARLIDGLAYDDEIKTDLKHRLNIGKTDKLNLLPIARYGRAVSVRSGGSDHIALIYAEGDIVDGQGSNGNIGGDHFRDLIRKARLDNSVKAIVMRVNSGGGSALASENIWRELHMAQQDGKPVVVSFGDVAASGGYYISCGADSIFASPNTITGSIGVFSIIPNMGGFFKNKLGISFDGVKTAPYADASSGVRAMTDFEKLQAQQDVERIYARFKQRVSEGRKKDTAYIESIAQGHVWSGSAGLQNGLVDRIGTLQDAINAAAKLARLKDFGLREYPEPESLLQQFLNRKKTEPEAMIRQQLGEADYKTYLQLMRIRQMTGMQARLPFEFMLN